jgi:hypothetical protein
VAGRVHRCPLPLLIPCLAVLAGCGSHAAATTPEGFTVRRVEEPRLAIALPRRWRSFDRRSKASAKDIAVRNKSVRAELDVLGRADSPIKLIALAPSKGRSFLTNMNVLQTRVPSSLTFEQLSRNEARQIELAAHVREMRQDETELPAGRALRLRYRAPSRAIVHQYFVRHGEFLYILTYTTSPAAASRYAKIFEMSAHTLTIG